MEEFNVGPFSLTEGTDGEEETIDSIDVVIPEEEFVYEEEEQIEETSAATILRQYIEDGLVDYDEEIDPKLKGSELMEILSNKAYQKAEATLETKGFTKENREVIDMLRSGSSQEEIQNIITTQSYSSLDIADDSDLTNREILIKAYHKEIGLSDKKAEQLYSLSISNDETYEEALQAKEFFAEKELYLVSQAKEREEQARIEQEQSRKETEENMNNMLNTGRIGDMDLSRSEANKLKSFIKEPTESYKYIDDRGKEVTTKVSKFYLASLQYEQNLEWQLVFAKMLMDGFKMDKVINTAKSERDKETKDVLNGKLSRTKAISGGNKLKGNGTEKDNRVVGEFII